jgi:hypothetical protein
MGRLAPLVVAAALALANACSAFTPGIGPLRDRDDGGGCRPDESSEYGGDSSAYPGGADEADSGCPSSDETDGESPDADAEPEDARAG